MSVRARPTSPHLQIYRWTITMAMSILHRATGIANYAGMALFVIWLVAAGMGQDTLPSLNYSLACWLGQLVLFGFTWSLVHHMLGGIRHFVWDTAAMMEPGQRETMAWATIIGSVVLTLIIWTISVWAA